MKPIEARQIEARSRARTLGVHVRVVVPGRHYTTHSQTSEATYHVTRTAHGWTCDPTCKGWTYTGCCKHVAAVERRSEREGWRFGFVAPRLAMAPANEQSVV